MANGKITLGKQSGGTLGLVFPDGVSNTEVVLPESGNITSVNTAVTDNAIARFDSTTGKLQNSGVTIDDNGNIGSGAQSFNGFGGVGVKNYLINGNFDLWQYKDAGLTYPQTSSGYGSDDRWNNGNYGSTKNHSRVSCTDAERALFNANFFSRTVVSSVAGASNYCLKTQYIENVTKLAGKTVTLSFWAKADSAKNIAIEFGQNFGTGGSPSATMGGIGSQLVALTTSWKKFTITLTIPSIAGKTLGTDGVHTTALWLNIWFDAGSSFNIRSASLGQQSGTFDIAQVQVEEGSVPTPFEQRPYGLELSLCQRYYQISTFYKTGYYNIASSYNIVDSYPLSVAMRVTPSSSFTNITNANPSVATVNTSYTVANNSLVYQVLYGTAGSTGAFSCSGQIMFSAEL